MPSALAGCLLDVVVALNVGSAKLPRLFCTAEPGVALEAVTVVRVLVKPPQENSGALHGHGVQGILTVEPVAFSWGRRTCGGSKPAGLVAVLYGSKELDRGACDGVLDLRHDSTRTQAS